MGRASLNSSWSLVEVGLAETRRIWLDLKEIWSNLNEILFGFKKIWADIDRSDKKWSRTAHTNEEGRDSDL